MLVISRKTEEFLQIGDNIIIKVIKSSNGSVKIGIEAPEEIRVVRGELQESPLPIAKTRLSGRWTTGTERNDVESGRIVEAV